jgi:hypothetical protein
MSEIKIVGKLEKIPLAKLHFQFIPILTDLELWNHDMSLPNSPQVEVASLLLKHGKNWSKLKDCRYAQDRRHRFKCGQKKWTEKAIKEHILGSRYSILRSLKKRGFRKEMSKQQPISVLREPLWKSRFGYDTDWLQGAEIYHGGRRCAAAYVLGWKTVPGYWARDKRKPGDKGKFETKLKGLGVWT